MYDIVKDKTLSKIKKDLEDFNLKDNYNFLIINGKVKGYIFKDDLIFFEGVNKPKKINKISIFPQYNLENRVMENLKKKFELDFFNIKNISQWETFFLKFPIIFFIELVETLNEFVKNEENILNKENLFRELNFFKHESNPYNVFYSKKMMSYLDNILKRYLNNEYKELVEIIKECYYYNKNLKEFLNNMDYDDYLTFKKMFISCPLKNEMFKYIKKDDDFKNKAYSEELIKDYKLKENYFLKLLNLLKNTAVK